MVVLSFFINMLEGEMESEWAIDSEWYWHMGTEGIRFVLRNEEERHLFEISRIALVDLFRTEDTRKKAEELFVSNQDRIIALCLKLLSEKGEQERQLIKLETLQRLGF